MNQAVKISGTISEDPVRVSLPASKSISNRALIVRALAKGSSTIKNLSNANDTRLMMSLLEKPSDVLNAQDAGTTMRFLTAYCAISGQHTILEGTDRMHERPIGVLVDALNRIGADIHYLKKKGFPPLEINPFESQESSYVEIPGNVSSQYISALMMIAPVLIYGLEIELTGKVGSRPYIEMTSEVMKAYGILPRISQNRISVEHSHYLDVEYEIEPDWSAASYWYSFKALTNCSAIYIEGLRNRSIQGDSRIVEYMEPLGVFSEFTDKGVQLTSGQYEQEVEYDLADTPDLAQTLAVVCAAKGIRCVFRGLESLRIKETDRIAALQQELAKLNASLTEKENTWILEPSSQLPEEIKVKTYHDHRMAMSFAPLANLVNVTIEDPSVVRKSYPNFWDDLQSVGYSLTFR